MKTIKNLFPFIAALGVFFLASNSEMQKKMIGHVPVMLIIFEFAEGSTQVFRWGFDKLVAATNDPSQAGRRAFIDNVESALLDTREQWKQTWDETTVDPMWSMLNGTVMQFAKQHFEARGFRNERYVDMSKEENMEATIKPNTKMLFAETPTNPLLKIIDLEKLADFARSKNIITVADNTFCSPYIQRPLTKGFDYVIHSATKYLCGHSDVIMGVLVMKDAESDNSKRLSNIHNSLGPISSPFDSYLALRSLKTLALRMERHSSNAEKIAAFLESHPKISKVIYPGLESHPQHSVAKKQMDFFGGMISVEIKDGLKASKTFLEKTSLFTLAESLGGVESLIEHPALMTHASISKEVRDQIGITDGLVRLSVGIESADDLINDLDKALN